MSDTAHVARHLSEYLDHALPAQEKHAVEKHLEHCKECSARYKELQQLRHRLKTAPELTPPESFYQGVLEQIERDKKPFLIWDWPMATKALATFGVLMVVVMVAREARRSEPELLAPVAPAALRESAPPAPSLSTPPAANAGPAPVPEGMHAEAIASANAPAELKQKASRKMDSLTTAPMAGMAFTQAKTKEKNAELQDDLKSLAPEALHGKFKAMPTQGALVANGLVAQNELQERKKDVSSLGYARQNLDAALATAQSVDETAAAGGGKATLQARDTGGVATQGSFAESQQQGDKETLNKVALARTEWKGDQSAISTVRTVVIDNEADWKALWAEHTQNQTPPPPAPAVDFDHFTAVGVFAGSKPSGGYSIIITDIKNGSDTITLNYHEQSPPPEMPVTAVITTPYDIRLIPKASLPITFIKQP